MKKLLLLMIISLFVLSGCVHHGRHHHRGHGAKPKVKVVVPARVLVSPRAARVVF